MNGSECVVVSKNDRNTPRIRGAVHSQPHFHGLIECQFGMRFSQFYEYNNEKFCIMHLPLEGKQKHRLTDKAKEDCAQLIKENILNYDYVILEGANFALPIYFEDRGVISFTGAKLYSCKFFPVFNRGENHCSIDFHYVLFEGVTLIKNIKSNILRIFYSDILSDLKIENCQIETLAILGSKIQEGNGIIGANNNHNLRFPQSTIKIFNFTRNECKVLVEFDFATIFNLNISDSIFFVTPSFFNIDFVSGNRKIMLPQRKHFKFEYRILSNDFRELYKNIKFNIFPNICKRGKRIYRPFSILNFIKSFSLYKKGINRALDQELVNLREIYNLAKGKEFTKEQGDYFYLMNFVNERNTDVTITRRILSIFYRWFSCYGTSLSRIFLWFLILNIVFTIFYTYSSHLSRPILISFQQIVKPFNLFFDSKYHYDFFTYFCAFLQSSISISLLALFLITVRWNFKRE